MKQITWLKERQSNNNYQECLEQSSCQLMFLLPDILVAAGFNLEWFFDPLSAEPCLSQRGAEQLAESCWDDD